MDEVLLFTAILHKRLTCSVAPGLDVNDFPKKERELYSEVSSELFRQLARISDIKNKFNNYQQKKLKTTMRIGKYQPFIHHYIVQIFNIFYIFSQP